MTGDVCGEGPLCTAHRRASVSEPSPQSLRGVPHTLGPAKPPRGGPRIGLAGGSEGSEGGGQGRPLCRLHRVALPRSLGGWVCPDRSLCPMCDRAWVAPSVSQGLGGTTAGTLCTEQTPVPARMPVSPAVQDLALAVEGGSSPPPQAVAPSWQTLSVRVTSAINLTGGFQNRCARCEERPHEARRGREHA